METKFCKIDKKSLELAKEIIRGGGVIVFPTETVYGIGCAFDNKEAAQKIFDIKGRGQNKPLSLHLASTSEIEQYVIISAGAKKLIDKHLPGPLMIILKKRADCAVATDGDTLGIRVPSSPAAREIIQKCGPILATSANPSGAAPAVTAGAAREYFGGVVPLILDGGKIEAEGLASTVADMSGSEMKVLREGKIKI